MFFKSCLFLSFCKYYAWVSFFQTMKSFRNTNTDYLSHTPSLLLLRCLPQLLAAPSPGIHTVALLMLLALTLNAGGHPSGSGKSSAEMLACMLISLSLSTLSPGTFQKYLWILPLFCLKLFTKSSLLVG